MLQYLVCHRHNRVAMAGRQPFLGPQIVGVLEHVYHSKIHPRIEVGEQMTVPAEDLLTTGLVL